MLTDAPDAYWTTLADVEGLGEDAWRARSTDRTLQVRSAGTPLGTATVLTPDPAQLPGTSRDDALVLAAYVVPAARGTGVLDLLMTGVHDLAREIGARRLVLHVGEGNARGRAAYARHGYALTGGVLQHPTRGTRDLEMARPV